MNITSQLLSVLSPSILIVVIGWVVRSICTQILSKDIEKYKSELSIAAYEHSVSFNRLHEKRAKVIEELYLKLLNTQQLFHAFKSYKSTNLNEKDRLLTIAAVQSGFDAYKYLIDNELYFKKGFSKKVADLTCELFCLASCYRLMANLQNIVVSNLESQEKAQFTESEMMKIWNNIHSTIPNLLDELKDDFRLILGVK